MTTESIRVEGLRKLYGKKVAVQDVSIPRRSGEVVTPRGHREFHLLRRRLPGRQLHARGLRVGRRRAGLFRPLRSRRALSRVPDEHERRPLVRLALRAVLGIDVAQLDRA